MWQLPNCTQLVIRRLAQGHLDNIFVRVGNFFVLSRKSGNLHFTHRLTSGNSQCLFNTYLGFQRSMVQLVSLSLKEFLTSKPCFCGNCSKLPKPHWWNSQIQKNNKDPDSWDNSRLTSYNEPDQAVSSTLCECVWIIRGRWVCDWGLQKEHADLTNSVIFKDQTEWNCRRGHKPKLWLLWLNVWVCTGLSGERSTKIFYWS